MLSQNIDHYISIVIPTRNNEYDLIDCLNSIVNLNYSLDKIEIIIWDNNSTQESKRIVKDHLYDLREEKDIRIQFIECNDNYGGFTSRDELFKRVSPNTKYILSIDDDVILPAHLLAELLPIFQQNNSIGIIGPRTVFDSNPSKTAHGAGFINWWIGRYTTIDAKKSIECDYVIGCCMLIKKSVINDIGGFDLDYFTSHGEVDFCLRAMKRGYQVFYKPDIKVRHKVAMGGTRTPERLYYVYRNKLFIIKKNAPIPQKWFSLSIYSLLWLPKSILDSIITHRCLNYNEIKIIMKAMFDGCLNRTGKRI